jgi:hypothetical protein
LDEVGRENNKHLHRPRGTGQHCDFVQYEKTLHWWQDVAPYLHGYIGVIYAALAAALDGINQSGIAAGLAQGRQPVTNCCRKQSAQVLHGVTYDTSATGRQAVESARDEMDKAICLAADRPEANQQRSHGIECQRSDGQCQGRIVFEEVVNCKLLRQGRWKNYDPNR